MRNPKVMVLNGEYWFSRAYAAQLLGTTRDKIMTMTVRGFLFPHPMLGDDWVAESDVNHLRHTPEQYAWVKNRLKEPRRPAQAEKMPASTIYKDDPPPERMNVRGRIGPPLKDSPQQ